MIPFVVIGGWLGAGKTTYINTLLREAKNERLAVVVNDVGELNIDASLIESHAGSTVELTNGCVCCTIGGSLGITLKDLVESERPPDRIVIEASGIADPAKVARYGDRRRLSLEAIVVLVDVTTIVSRLNDVATAGQYRSQLAAADVLLPTKTDLVDDNGWRERLGELKTGPVSELRVVTSTWYPPAPVDLLLVRTLLTEAGLWRAKGYVTSPDGQRLLIQGVGARVELRPTEVGGVDGVVLIDGDPEAIKAVIVALSAIGGS